ncbi:TerB family tellurite resistance protein [Camelimonas abortus]|uniref:TerB family tellurite resistance protein n=1 Tax=Camelimonas abortus TaxID=1017184 RepID=A0ABV7LFY6_9HYPH
MSVWGKLGGLGLGAVTGGPLGALIGAAAGHALVDRPGSPAAQALAATGRFLESTGLFAPGGVFGPPPPEVIYATGLVALCAKMARADGVVTEDEIAAFRRIIDVPPQDLPRVQRLFDIARQTTVGFDVYARQLARTFAGDRPLLESVLDALFRIACADHAVHEAELAFLQQVADIFGFTAEEFALVRASHLAEPDDPWRILGAHPDMSDAELQRCYRRQIAEHHPDRLIAAGLPQEAVAVANARAAAINAAFARIRAMRAGPAPAW